MVKRAKDSQYALFHMGNKPTETKAMAFDKAGILAILSEPLKGNNKYIVFRMLQAMYQRQTTDEQASENTHHSNGVGFNGVDAPFLSDVAKKSAKYKGLTDGQAKAVAKCLKKYSGQLATIAATNSQAKL